MKISEFDFDSAFDRSDAPMRASYSDDVRRSMREEPSLIDPARLIRGISLSVPIYWFRKGKSWMVNTEESTAAGAEKFGKRLQKALAPKRSLSASDPYLHNADLYVTYANGFVRLAGEPERGPRNAHIADEKNAIVRRATSVFGANGVKLAGHDGAYALTIRPALKKFKGKFAESTIRAATLVEIAQHLEKAIGMVQ